MIRKNLCIIALAFSMILQGPNTYAIQETTTSSAISAPDEQTPSSSITEEDLKKEQEKIKIEQQKKQAQELLEKKHQQELQKKKEQLENEITINTYLSYIKNLGYYKKLYKNDEKLNIRIALLLFQSNHNMSVTGKWDEATKQMLIKRLLSTSFTYIDTIKKAPSKGKWIVVNKTTRVLTLYDGTTAIKKFAVAVGNPASLTKSGKYILTMKIKDPDWGGGGFADPVKGGSPKNPLGSRWLGINRTDGSYGIHGTNSLYSIGTYASHGCIRMYNAWVEEIFPLIPLKANIWVGTNSELKKWGVTQAPFVAQTDIK